MNFNTLKSTIAKSLLKTGFDLPDEKVNSITVGCLVYNMVDTMAARDTSILDRIPKICDEYSKSYKGIVENLTKKYISYKQITDYITDNSIGDFASIKESQLWDIVKLYGVKQERKAFSRVTYSQYMYNVYNISEKDNAYLRKMHYNVIVPIAEYYITYNGINESSISIENMFHKMPGKGIRISISGVPSSKIYHDISMRSIDVLAYIHKMSLADNNSLELIMK